MPTDPERPWETPEEQAAKQQPTPDPRSWLARRWLLVAIAALIVVTIGWSVRNSDREEGRIDSGYTACRQAVKQDLIGDYSPEITVYFEETLTDGTLIYSAQSDDGDGQWTCRVPANDGPNDVEVSNGLWDD